MSLSKIKRVEKKNSPANRAGVADSSASEMYEQCLPVRGKTFRQKKNALNRGRRTLNQNHYALRINALRIELIPFLSLAGQTVIVNQAILLAPGLSYLRLLKLSFNDIIAELLAVTVA